MLKPIIVSGPNKRDDFMLKYDDRFMWAVTRRELQTLVADLTAALEKAAPRA